MPSPGMREAHKQNNEKHDYAHAHKRTVEKLGPFQAQLASRHLQAMAITRYFDLVG